MISNQNTLSSSQSAECARYWIIQHIPDSFRRETRNVGVIVQKNSDLMARFFGEGETSGSFDNRTLRAFKNPKVYRQWVRYWKRLIDESKNNLEAELNNQHFDNFKVIDGGVIDRTGTDTAATVCEYAYSMLVSEGKLEDALRNEQSAIEANIALRDVVAKTFREMDLMGTGGNLFVKNPILAHQAIIGKKSVHDFTFIQSSRTLDLMEPLNLLTVQKRHARERAGWMAFAFEDAKAVNRDKEVRAIVLAEMPKSIDDVTKYCLESLEGVASVVSWNDTASRQQFLSERQQAAAFAF